MFSNFRFDEMVFAMTLVATTEGRPSSSAPTMAMTATGVSP
jgi:hypothetical protein